MKKQKKINPLSELKNGAFEGGFSVIQHKEQFIVAGAAEPTNNCTGHCGINNCSGGNCGNCVQGCGVKQ